jgi:hypothetical protein
MIFQAILANLAARFKDEKYLTPADNNSIECSDYTAPPFSPTVTSTLDPKYPILDVPSYSPPGHLHCNSGNGASPRHCNVRPVSPDSHGLGPTF